MEQIRNPPVPGSPESSFIVTEPLVSSDDHDEPQTRYPLSIVLRALGGVATATKATSAEMQPAVDAIESAADSRRSAIHRPNQNTSADDEVALSLLEWYAHVAANTTIDDSARHRANIAVALAFLCHSGRNQFDVHAADLDFTWELLSEALLSPSISYTVSRSAGGFLAVPLWSVVTNGDIEELFRFHVWLPDGKRGTPGMEVHAHQPFAQSWVLAGEGRNHSYAVETIPAGDAAAARTATHAEYALTWADSTGKPAGTAYQTHQKFSVVANTGRLVRARHAAADVHSRNMTYSVGAGACHRSDVAADALHATLFLFDASRGFERAAPVLGPVDGEPVTAHRNPAGVTAADLVGRVDAVRAWETLYHTGQRHGRGACWDEAAAAYRAALHVCTASPSFPDSRRYQQTVLAQLGHVDRMLGRCEPVAPKPPPNGAANPTTTVV